MTVAGILVGSMVGCATPTRVTDGEAAPKSDNSGRHVEPQPDASLPIGFQLLQADTSLREMKFSPLLNFETDSDLVFTASEPPTSAAIDGGVKFTGHSSLKLTPDLRQITFRLPVLLGGRPFPEKWNLVGPYARTDTTATWTLSYIVSGKTVSRRSLKLEAGRWTPLMLDVGAREDVPAGEIGKLVLEPAGVHGPLWVDDLLLIENAATLVDTRDGDEKYAWVVERRGFAYTADAPGRFKLTLQTPESSPAGWTLVEADSLRCRFASTGRQKALTVYADGRAFWDGQFKPLVEVGGYDAQLAQQHDTPGELTVPEDEGRVNRSSDGDANNDGYNENRGTYTVAAAASHVEVHLIPRGVPLYRPMLEITGLPAGAILATVEGRLVERVSRTPDGTVLVDVPVKMERETIVNVRVQ